MLTDDIRRGVLIGTSVTELVFSESISIIYFSGFDERNYLLAKNAIDVSLKSTKFLLKDLNEN